MTSVHYTVVCDLDEQGLDVQSALEQNVITSVTTDEEGNASFDGIKSGEYFLEEVEAPDGYQKLTDPVKVDLPSDAGSDFTVQIKNDPLPTTDLNVTNIDMINQVLSGGSFVVYKYDKDGKKLYYHESEDTGKATWVDIGDLDIIEAVDQNIITVKEAGEDGSVTFPDLTADTYYVQQIIAPDGYLLADPDTIAEITVDSGEEVNVKVINTTGTVLPETGGIGTDLFYMLGIVFMALACCITIRMKKKN